MFWQESCPVSFTQNQVWVKVNFSFSVNSDAFLLWWTLFHLYSVSKKRHITDMHWKCSHKAVKNSIFKTSIKYMLYAVNCKQYTVSYRYSFCISKEKLKYKSNLLPKSNHQCLQLCCLLLFCVSAVFVTDTVFVVISCQDWLGLNISSNGQEVVWFFLIQ